MEQGIVDFFGLVVEIDLLLSLTGFHQHEKLTKGYLLIVSMDFQIKLKSYCMLAVSRFKRGV